jgi:hypothetical protein
VLNVAEKVNGNMYIEIHQHGSYIILISGTREEWERIIYGFLEQLGALAEGKFSESWNARARFVVPVMGNCTYFDSIETSRAILRYFGKYQVPYATVLFVNSSEQESKSLQKSINDSEEGTLLELHTWNPYENSRRCDPAEGAVPVKVFTARSVSDIRRNDIFKGHFVKNLHGCTIKVHFNIRRPHVNPPKRILNNNSGYHSVYDGGWEIELLGTVAISLKMSLDIKDRNKTEYRTDAPYIYIGVNFAFHSTLPFEEYTQSYHSVHYVWYMPCAVKYQRWSPFFKIFSVDLWMYFSVSLVLAVITVSCISGYRHKSHMHEFNSYSNILSIAANIIAISLSPSVHTRPRTASLRVFFLSWVSYSVAINTVFQTYLTTYLIEPGYEEPIKTVDQMLKSEKKVGFFEGLDVLHAGNSDSVGLAIHKDAVRRPDYDSCFILATVYHNISTILHDLNTEIYRQRGNWTNEENRPLLCEMEDGPIRKDDIVFLVSKRNPLLEYINEVIAHIAQGETFTQIKKRYYDKLKIQSKFDTYTFDDTYFAISVKDLQTAFYLLLKGYALALFCFVIEIMWHRYRSKWRETKRTSLSRADINRQLISLSEVNPRLYMNEAVM